ncbi:MAG TPA: hypothetical protein H9870_04875 [Candidatus Corynebacterium avicola]|uniref:Uncharacterized protein n=1 Tax=Candidatus Corynebacterium avicola TaxID=2838527 RepID=A0A9D1RP33_9CORY|nr:hypothetical protein [Candidatus Corynebacterium avicola]
MAVVSVIGPDVRLVGAVVVGLRGSRHRVVTGAGPSDADGVIAVVGTSQQDAVSAGQGDDAQVVRAVRDAMGLCVLHVSEDALSGDLAEVAAEPGVVVSRWSAPDGPDAPASLETLARLVEPLWVDVRRWTADARRADADRADRVRIAVRLAAERLATELLADPVAGRSGRTDMTEMDRIFRARLTVAVLEQGVEMPSLGPGVGEDAAGADRAVPVSASNRASGKIDGVTALTGVAALGAGAAVGAAVTRTIGAPLLGVVAGVPVALVTFLLRWRTHRSARRTQDAAAAAALLRRHWAATVTDVVSRLSVPTIADTLADFNTRPATGQAVTA